MQAVQRELSMPGNNANTAAALMGANSNAQLDPASSRPIAAACTDGENAKALPVTTAQGTADASQNIGGGAADNPMANPDQAAEIGVGSAVKASERPDNIEEQKEEKTPLGSGANKVGSD